MSLEADKLVKYKSFGQNPCLFLLNATHLIIESLTPCWQLIFLESGDKERHLCAGTAEYIFKNILSTQFNLKETELKLVGFELAIMVNTPDKIV